MRHVMIVQFLFKSLVVIGIFLHSAHVVGSVMVLESKTSERVSEKLQIEVENIVDTIAEICFRKTNNIYTQRTQISQQLRSVLDKNSPLVPFPQLSSKIYDELSQILQKIYKAEPSKAPYILHLWSYMTGIPVVGLRHGKNYYAYNNHLIPEATKEECKGLRLALGTLNFRVTVDRMGVELQKLHTKPSEISHSAWVCVKEHIDNPLSNEQEEAPRIAWSLIEEDLVPLEEIGSERIDKVLTKFLFKKRSLRSKKNSYSFGLIKLFQNTALYLSLADDDSSGVIVSPCSKDTISYFGLIDGIFIDRVLLDKHSERIHHLFGEQLFIRGFFRKIPCFHREFGECEDCQHTVRGLYYPHYDLTEVDDTCKKYSLASDSESLLAKKCQFVQAFSSYMENRDEASVERLIKFIDKQQLKIVLSTGESSLRQLCRPGYTLEINSMVGSEDESLSGTTWNVHSFIETLIEHLTQVEYQIARKIDLSNNQLTNTEVEALGKVFNKNILSHLRQVDLSRNSIKRKGLLALHGLLKRDSFLELRVSGSPKSLPASFSPRVANKIIWS
jgi:hypothetical protein